MTEVREERTGWRDSKLSARHRMWGFDCPMVDIDWLNVEYDNAEPTGIVEYKHEYAPPQYRTHPSYQALIKLADTDRPELPVFAVRYTDKWQFKVRALNDIGKQELGGHLCVEMTEVDWVAFLYKLRGREMPESVRWALTNEDIENPEEML